MCTRGLDHLQCIVCLGSTLSGGSPLYALIIHTQLLLAERNSARRSFLHLIFFHFPPTKKPTPPHPTPPRSPPSGRRQPVVPFRRSRLSAGSFLPRSNLARVNYICYSARVNTSRGIKAEANRRRPAGRLEPLQGRQRRGAGGEREGRAGRHPVSGAPPRPAQ